MPLPLTEVYGSLVYEKVINDLTSLEKSLTFLTLFVW